MQNLSEPSSLASSDTLPSSSVQTTPASTSAHGSTPRGGGRTIEQILRDMEKLVPDQLPAIIEAKPLRPSTSPTTSNAVALKPQEVALRDSPQAQNQLTDLLAQTYALLKKYGEKADLTELRDTGFQWLLSDYPISTIEAAFRKYLTTAREIPTPADILAIIDPKTQPLDRAVYIRLSRKDPGDLDWQERDYMRAFERQEMRKL